MPWGAFTSPAGLDPLCLNTDIVRAETAQLWLPPHCQSTGDSAFNHSLSNLPSISDPFPDKHSLLELVFYKEEGYFQTKEHIQTGRGRKRKKTPKPPRQQLWAFIPWGKPAKRSGFLSLVIRESICSSTRPFYASPRSQTRLSACCTVTHCPVGGFTASCFHKEFPALVYYLLPPLGKDTHCANPHSSLETGTEHL